MRRPCPAGRQARHRQDHASARFCSDCGRGFPTGAVHARPSPVGPDGYQLLQPEDRRVRVPARSALHQLCAGGRDQPRHATHPVGPAGSHGGKADHGGRRDEPPGRAVHGAGDPEPAGILWHFPAAGCPDGPLFHAAVTGVHEPGAGDGSAVPPVAQTVLSQLNPVVTPEETAYVRTAYREVKVSDDVKNYLMDIVEATRMQGGFVSGVSTRGALALYQAAQAYAALQGRDYVIPEDIKGLAPAVLCHREPGR